MGEGSDNKQKRKVSGLLDRTSAMEKHNGGEADWPDCREGCGQFKVIKEGIPEKAAQEQELTKGTGARREPIVCPRFPSRTVGVGGLGCSAR